MIAALFALLLQLLAHVGSAGVEGVPVPHQHVVVHPLPHDVSDAPQAADEVPAGPVVDHADSIHCAAGEEWQGEFGCVAVQLPGETIGRADW